MTDLSVLIPARNEMFLKNTIEDILTHAEGDTEIIAVLDGAWADPPLHDHPPAGNFRPRRAFIIYPEKLT